MPLTWVCPDCTATYGGPLSGCPRCLALPRTAADSAEDDMPKITIHGGPSNFTADWSDDEPVPDRIVTVDEPLAEQHADGIKAGIAAEGSASSPGTSTSESSTPSPSRSGGSESSAPGPAPTTELLSKSPQAESFTADPTVGSTPVTGEQDKPPAEDYDTRTVVELRGLLKDRGLSTAGSKADMVQRLQDDDAEDGAA